jgi:vesicle-fusing ATPase
MLDPKFIQHWGIQHVKGILMYGPSGCGKTTMARQICKMIGGVEPKIVSAPELFNMYIGNSEKLVRELFVDAEKDWKENGINAKTHVIIIDEIDSVAQKRGISHWKDSVVNQLLAKMDGVDGCNNFIVIGMTNRLDILDEALLRPGRFEVKLEVTLPDEIARTEILRIHVKKLLNNNGIHKDVSIDMLARITKNYTGAELEGLVNSAKSNALTRAIEYNMVVNETKMCVMYDDFMMAFKEIKPKYGIDQNITNLISKYGIMMWAKEFKELYEKMYEDIMKFINSDNKQMIIQL